MTATATKPVVAISVRPVDGDEGARLITFAVPDGIDPLDLLDKGFALDGTEAAATVAYDPNAGRAEAGFFGPFDRWGYSLTQALREVERELVAYLRARGFEPTFA